MDVAFEPNNDARSEKAYTKNLPMLKIQTHETVNPEDWQGLLCRYTARHGEKFSGASDVPACSW